MMKLPRNRRILVERETEKERKLLLKEAKEELWKRWRQKKGRINQPKLKNGEEDLEKKLKRIEEEVSKYKEEMKTKETEEKTRRERLEKKKQKEKHWEMLRWVVNFIDENRNHWEGEKIRKRKDLEESEKREAWKHMTEEEKIEEIRKEENQDTETPETKKQKRLEKAEMRKKSWKIWREDRELESEEEKETQETEKEEKENWWEEETETEELELAKTLDKVETEEWKEELGLETSGELCMLCIFKPCICLLTKLEMKINILRETDRKEEKKEMGGLLGGQKAAQEPSYQLIKEGEEVGGLLGGHRAAQEPSKSGKECEKETEKENTEKERPETAEGEKRGRKRKNTETETETTMIECREKPEVPGMSSFELKPPNSPPPISSEPSHKPNLTRAPKPSPKANLPIFQGGNSIELNPQVHCSLLAAGPPPPNKKPGNITGKTSILSRQNFFENLTGRNLKKQKTNEAENQTKIKTAQQKPKKEDDIKTAKPPPPPTKPKPRKPPTSEQKKTSEPKQNKTKPTGKENLPKIDKYLAVLKTNQHRTTTPEPENNTTKQPLLNQDPTTNQPICEKEIGNQTLEPTRPDTETKPSKKPNLIQDRIKLFSSSTPPKLPRIENHHPLTKPEESKLEPNQKPTRTHPILGPTPEQTKPSTTATSTASQETKPKKQTPKTKQGRTTSTPKTRARNSKSNAEKNSLDQPDIRLFLAKNQGAEVAAAADSSTSIINHSKSEINSATVLQYSLGTTSLSRLAKPNACRVTAEGGKVQYVKPTTIGQNGGTQK